MAGHVRRSLNEYISFQVPVIKLFLKAVSLDGWVLKRPVLPIATAVVSGHIQWITDFFLMTAYPDRFAKQGELFK